MSALAGFSLAWFGAASLVLCLLPLPEVEFQLALHPRVTRGITMTF